MTFIPNMTGVATPPNGRGKKPQSTATFSTRHVLGVCVCVCITVGGVGCTAHLDAFYPRVFPGGKNVVWRFVHAIIFIWSQLCGDYFISHYKDSYEPTRIPWKVSGRAFNWWLRWWVWFLFVDFPGNLESRMILTTKSSWMTAPKSVFFDNGWRKKTPTT